MSLVSGGKNATNRREEKSDYAIDEDESDERSSCDGEQRAHNPLSEVVEALQDRDVARRGPYRRPVDELAVRTVPTPST